MAKWWENRYEVSRQSSTACNIEVIFIEIAFTFYGKLANQPYTCTGKIDFSHLSDRSAKWWTIDSTSIEGFDTNERKIACFNMTEGSCIENNEFMVSYTS